MRVTASGEPGRWRSPLLDCAPDFGLFAFMTWNGLTTIPRVALENGTDFDLAGVGFPARGLDQIAVTFFATDPKTLRWPLALVPSSVFPWVVPL